LSLTEPHDEFLELCAVSTSGQLSEAELSAVAYYVRTFFVTEIGVAR